MSSYDLNTPCCVKGDTTDLRNLQAELSKKTSTHSLPKDDVQNESEMKEEEEDQYQLTPKGQRMAASLAEYLLMRYFFPGRTRAEQK